LAQLDSLATLAAPDVLHHTDANAKSTPEGWTNVIAPGSKAILCSTSGNQEVAVLGHVYTPSGLHYHLAHSSPTVRWMVQANALTPINGVTVTQLYNLMTGELKQAA
jgi:hypothetical protein